MSYVICPETIVSPAPPPGFLAAFPELRPNEPCGCRVPVRSLGPIMEFRCPYGHAFFASDKDVCDE